MNIVEVFCDKYLSNCAYDIVEDVVVEMRKHLEDQEFLRRVSNNNCFYKNNDFSQKLVVVKIGIGTVFFNPEHSLSLSSWKHCLKNVLKSNEKVKYMFGEDEVEFRVIIYPAEVF